MKIFIIGGTGMLGHKLVQVLGEAAEVWVTIRGDFEDVEQFGIFYQERTIENIDVTDFERVRSAITKVKPDVVINAVGVIKQLPTSKDVIHTLTLNSLFPHRLSQISSEHGFRLISISTDCVFNGKTGLYTEAEMPNALDLYGQSKRWGEITAEGCLTVRTSIIGRELSSAHSLIEWFLSNRDSTVKGFSKAIYSGFPTIVFADILRVLIFEHKDLSGLFHVSSEPINKLDLLYLVRDAYGVDIEIERDEYFTIDRSLNSDRFRELTGFTPLPWPEMVKSMADDPTDYDKWRK